MSYQKKKVEKLQLFDLSYFQHKSHFEYYETQRYLVF